MAAFRSSRPQNASRSTIGPLTETIGEFDRPVPLIPRQEQGGPSQDQPFRVPALVLDAGATVKSLAEFADMIDLGNFLV